MRSRTPVCAPCCSRAFPALQCYPEIGLRPMEDVDVLVEPGRAREAIAALERAGWPATPVVEDPNAVPYGEQMLHQVACRGEGGHAIDLHWRFVPWVARDGVATRSALLGVCVPLDVAGHPTLSPCPDDLLLLVILHAHWPVGPPLRSRRRHVPVAGDMTSSTGIGSPLAP